MTSILDTQRSKESYFSEKLHSRSQSVKDATEYAIGHFKSFCKSKWNSSAEDIIEQLNAFTDKDKKEKKLYEILQSFVNYLGGSIQASSVRQVFSKFKPYIAYRADVRLHNEDVKSEIIFSKSLKFTRYGLSFDDVRKLLERASMKKRILYVTLLSSGMRLRECLMLRKRDFDTISLERWLINIPASYTKTGCERKTFISKEASDHLKPILAKLNDNDLVFTKNPDAKKAEIVEDVLFGRVRRYAGLDTKYENGTRKITLHSMRSYFISACEPIHEGFGHALAGHDKYMQSYERYFNKPKQLLDFYLSVEPQLVFFDMEIINKTHTDLEKRIQAQGEEIKSLRAFVRDVYAEQGTKTVWEDELNPSEKANLRKRYELLKAGKDDPTLLV